MIPFRISFQLKNPLGVVTVKFTENTVEGKPKSFHQISQLEENFNKSENITNTIMRQCIVVTKDVVILQLRCKYQLFSFEIVSIAGLSTHTINSIRANKAAKTLSMEIHVPKATARGRYHMQ